MVIKISGLSWAGEFEVYGKTVHTFVYASDTKEKAKELAKKPNYLTVPAAIRELEKIEMTRQLDKVYRLDHAVTKTQKVILSAFGMDWNHVKYRAKNISKILKGVQ